jgi:hypothetical protein
VDDVRPGLREALKTVAVALKDGDLPFALTGGYALWARGAPEPEHDVDFMVAEEDAAEAAQVLADHGLQVVQPPEDWLFKVYVDEAMVDVIFRAGGERVDRDRLDRVEQIEVESVRMPVLATTELLVDKLRAMDEHACDFERPLAIARAVREQVDWADLERRTEDNPFAASFLFLLERLGVVGGPANPGGS